MGLWSSTFGGGNSFTESVANTFTKDDGASYEGGNLVYDSGSNKGTAVAANTGGGYGGTNSDGTSVYSGGGQSAGTGFVVQPNQTLSEISAKTGVSVEQLMQLNNITDPKKLQSGAALKTVGSFFKDGVSIFDKKNTGTSSAKVKGEAPKSGLMSFTLPRIIGGIASWANGIDPDLDPSKLVDGRMIYTKKDGGMSYSYNFAKMPYEVTLVNGEWVDTLKLKKDDAGVFEHEEGFDVSTAQTGYSRSQANAVSSGDNDTANEIATYQANNSNPGSVGGGGGGGSTSSGDIAAMAEKAGLIKAQGDMEAILADPNKFLEDRGLKLADIMPSVDPDAEGTYIDPSNTGYGVGTNEGYTASNTGEVATVDNVVQPLSSTYDAEMNELTGDEMVNAATGTVSDDALVDAENLTIDMQGAATGVNADGTVSVLGEALNDFATQNISTVIDTSTVSGKLVAQKLGEGNYTDSKATVLGQMKIISAEFKSSNGDPIIPTWAQAMHRDASKSIAFNGISGTAATAAFSNAIMEATLGVAEQDATFFQTLTNKNLDNRQQAIINKANVLSNLEMANLDVRSQAAVQNAKAFMQMDIANLTNEQQAEVVNKQALVQAMFDNTSAVNAERLFTAKTDNDMNKFYSELQTSIARHNSSEINALSKFNAGEINDAAQFNADIKNDRQKFLANMQYNIDISNAKWRQTVETSNTQIMADAHTADIKAALDLTQEAQNALWDSADNLLDYIWKTADNDMERELRLLTAQMTAQSGQSSGGGFMSGLLGLGGAYLGTSTGASWLTGLLPFSDVRLKENIQHYDTLNGVNFYTWDWNEEGKKNAASQYPSFGVLAQEIKKTHPAAVVVGDDGYLRVNYGMIKNDV